MNGFIIYSIRNREPTRTQICFTSFGTTWVNGNQCSSVIYHKAKFTKPDAFGALKVTKCTKILSPWNRCNECYGEPVGTHHL